jgi:arginase family enzyme
MAISVVVFPFDQFGSAGTGAGAQLLSDAVQEIIDDTDAESRPTRADVHRDKVELHEETFDTMQELLAWRDMGRRLARERLDGGDFLIWLAGNHLAVLPVLEALGPDSVVVQFDAHLDIHAFHDTTEELTHGNFLLHAETPLPKLINVGHRDLLLKPGEIGNVFDAVHSAEDVACDPANVLKDLKKRVKSAKRVWIDLDCDALDPAFLPAVQVPVPFGLSPTSLLQFVNTIGCEKLAGISISEFDPGRDVRDTSLQLLGWFIERMMLGAAE